MSSSSDHSLSKPPTPPGWDAHAALRWQRQLAQSARTPWLHTLVAERMLERLDLLKLNPGPKLHWQPAFAGPQAHQALLTRFGQADTCAVVEQPAYFESFCSSVQGFIDFSATKNEANLGANPAARWMEKAKTWLTRSASTLVLRHALSDGLLPGQAQLVFSNMLLHGHTQPLQLMRQWHAALAVGGCAMFSALGVDTGRELRQAFATHGFGPAAAPLTDMHDYGDMLIEAGFGNPVMDMERLTLTYQSAQALLTEWRELGRNAHAHRFAGLRTPAWRSGLEAALAQALANRAPRPDGSLAITVELIYGHAFKPAPKLRMSEHSAISMQDMRTMLQAPARAK